MATVHELLQSRNDFFEELQRKYDEAERVRCDRYVAAMIMIRNSRERLIKKYFILLARYATIIQCAFRVHRARKAYRVALRRAVQNKANEYYEKAAVIIQALWRGHYSRRIKFCYRTYRIWLTTVRERSEKRAAEAVEFGIRSKADDLRILEEEARQWLAFVVFKLHHLLRTYVCAGVYSDPGTTELSEFENLLKSIHYTEYMKRLKRKYDEFVRKHRPAFSNKRLFPIIGDGADYWYLSLPEMYELTKLPSKKSDNRHKATHHGRIHKEPFLWKKIRPSGVQEGRGPFTPPQSQILLPPPPSPASTLKLAHPKDPRFHIYKKHYKPEPALFDYVDFHINVFLKRKFSVENIYLT